MKPARGNAGDDGSAHRVERADRADRADHVVADVRDWRLVVRLVGWLRPYRGLVAWQLALLGVASLVQVAQPLIVRDAIDHAIPSGDRGRLGALVGILAAVVAVEFAARYASTLATILTGQGVVKDLREAVFARMIRLDQSTFDRTPVGRLMVRVTSDVDALDELFASGIVTIVGDVMKLALLLVAMASLDASLTVAALAVAPFFAAGTWWFRVHIRDAHRAVRSRLSRLNADLQEVLVGIRVVKAFAQERREIRRFERRSRDLLDKDLGAVWYESAFSAAVDALATVALAALLWHGGGEQLRGVVSFGTLYAFVSFAQQFFTPLQDLALKYATLQTAMASTERVFALLDEKELITSPEKPDPRVASVDPTVLRRAGAAPAGAGVDGRIEFRAVTFAYPGLEADGGAAGDRDRAPLALRDVSFVVESGRSVALVGATGSGKTTVTRLLSRLHDVPRDRAPGDDAGTVPGGAVLLGGVDVRDWPLRVLRRNVGVVLQDPFLFAGTLRENLFVDAGFPADVESSDSEPRAWQALEAVGAADLARRLGGLDAPIRERGSNLSLGERQLVTLARALAHDPLVLVLDEATSAVDTMTERRVQAAVEAAREGRTSVVVAHRLSTVRDCDAILVFGKGALRESGTHDELLDRDGLYAALWRLQLASRTA